MVEDRRQYNVITPSGAFHLFLFAIFLPRAFASFVLSHLSKILSHPLAEPCPWSPLTEEPPLVIQDPVVHSPPTAFEAMPASTPG
jgi:hypothetical protein